MKDFRKEIEDRRRENQKEIIDHIPVIVGNLKKSDCAIVLTRDGFSCIGTKPDTKTALIRFMHDMMYEKKVLTEEELRECLEVAVNPEKMVKEKLDGLLDKLNKALEDLFDE